uniref:translation initiation factor IF-2-like n=1 Tax=Jaculus jaculus TaxID=51337 RepID=UPI001E1B4744|nr:translation initiation factor IF-2-like [Jaculus jaculus]
MQAGTEAAGAPAPGRESGGQREDRTPPDEGSDRAPPPLTDTPRRREPPRPNSTTKRSGAAAPEPREFRSSPANCAALGPQGPPVGTHRAGPSRAGPGRSPSSEPEPEGGEAAGGRGALPGLGAGEGTPSRRRSSLRGPLLGPRPTRPGPAAAVGRRAAVSSSAAPLRGGGRASLSGPQAPLLPLRPSDVRGVTGTASRQEPVGADAGSAARAAPLPQRRRRPGAVLLLPTCREDTEHARAETTSG